PLIDRVAGRAAGVVVAGDRRVPAGFFADLFGHYEFAVQRWQVVQPARDRVEVRIVRKSRFTAATEETIRRALADAVGPAVALQLVFVDEIAAGPDGGARPFVPLVTGSDEARPEDGTRREASR